MDKYVFLDFDGVLHTHSTPFFHYVPEFQFLLEAIHKWFAPVRVHIVFTTSWRLKQSAEALKSNFPQSVQALAASWAAVGFRDDKNEDNRYAFVREYIRRHGINRQDCLILDDMAALFYPYAGEDPLLQRLHVTENGLTRKDAGAAFAVLTQK